MSTSNSDAAAVFTRLSKPLPGFNLTSTDLDPSKPIGIAQVGDTFGCSGQNLSPQLSWVGAPKGTQSFAVVCYDPDAPTGSGWWHWLLFNLPASTNALPTGTGSADGARLPAGAAQAITDYGVPGYGGPCPPPGHGPHRYYFRVHALGVPKLELPAGASAALVGFNINGNTLATAELLATYSR